MGSSTDVRLEAGDHVVQFYDDEPGLCAVVVGYLDGALSAGDAAVVIATAEHRRAFTAALRSRGVDLDAAAADGRLVLLDAATTLAQFMADGLPDADTFRAVIGSVIRYAHHGARRVYAYGEMVALAWEAHNVVGAIELERLWNNLAGDVPFALLCAYPASSMELAGRAFAAVCDSHSAVVAGAPIECGAEASRRFVRSARSAGLAREFVAELLTVWSRRDLLEAAALLVTELAGNAIRHARSEFTVALTRHGDAVRIAVGDKAIDMPKLQDGTTTSPRGRGLVIVDALASAWGHARVDGGKLVWADITKEEPA